MNDTPHIFTRRKRVQDVEKRGDRIGIAIQALASLPTKCWRPHEEMVGVTGFLRILAKLENVRGKKINWFFLDENE